MIIGIGHDITDITRMAGILRGRTGSRFLERVLTAEEREVARQYSGERLYQHAAGRFAAKEAVVKAFGCGIGQIMSFSDITIMPAIGGRPECRLSEEAWKRLCLSPENIRIHVTITHERTLASAFAIAERIKA